MAEGTWIDAFVTEPAKVGLDSAFLGSVMSCKPYKASGSEFNGLKIVKESTNWITPRWIEGTNSYYSGDAKYTDFLNLQVGDLIYIGHNIGATTVRTVVERAEFGTIKNKTGEDLNLRREGHTGSGGDVVLGNGLTKTTSTPKFVAYKVDSVVNTTDLPTAGGLYTPIVDDDSSATAVNLATQHNFTFPDASMQSTDRPDAKHWCPLYKLNNTHLDSRLILPLDHGVKALHCVKLIAYSSNNKSLPGYLHYHELPHDDYVMLGIKELPASLLSNESTARGAFAALHISDTGETYEREPAGIATQYVNPGASNVRQLTLELTNRKGEPAHLGRLHLWFKLLVTHG